MTASSIIPSAWRPFILVALLLAVVPSSAAEWENAMPIHSQDWAMAAQLTHHTGAVDCMTTPAAGVLEATRVAFDKEIAGAPAPQGKLQFVVSNGKGCVVQAVVDLYECSRFDEGRIYCLREGMVPRFWYEIIDIYHTSDGAAWLEYDYSFDFRRQVFIRASLSGLAAETAPKNYPGTIEGESGATYPCAAPWVMVPMAEASGGQTLRFSESGCFASYGLAGAYADRIRFAITDAGGLASQCGYWQLVAKGAVVDETYVTCGPVGVLRSALFRNHAVQAGTFQLIWRTSGLTPTWANGLLDYIAFGA